MPVTISLTPQIPSYITGDPLPTVTMSGGDAGLYHWESIGGTFQDKTASSTLFIPKNATGNVRIIGRKVARGWSNTAGVHSYNSGMGLQKLSGTNHVWDSWGYLPNELTGTTSVGFSEAVSFDTTSEKAMGYFSNANYINPAQVGGIGTSFEYSWHLYPNGVAVPRKQGSPITNPVTYKAGSIFRVSFGNEIVNYWLDERIVASATRNATGTYYPCQTFKTLGAIWDYTVGFWNPVENEGVYTLPVVGVFPVQPNFSYDISPDSEVLESIALDGSSIRKRKIPSKKVLSLQFLERDYTEKELISNFWKAHEKHARFIYQDLLTAESYIVKFQEGLRTTPNNAGSFTLQATLKEV